MREFITGDTIRVRDRELEYFMVTYQKKVAGRVAVVQRVFSFEGETKKNYRIAWQKKNGRGKVWEEVIRSNQLRYYELAP